MKNESFISKFIQPGSVIQVKDMTDIQIIMANPPK